MDAYRWNVKLDFELATEIDLERLIPIFHRWIQERALDELLIDVADYRHVAQGPGVLLIAHDANYAVDEVDGRLGLLYARKRPAAGSFADRLRDAVGKLLDAGLALEREAALGGLAIPGDRWSVQANDRLLAPNNERTWQAVEPELRALFDGLYAGGGVDLRREDDPRALFGVTVRAAEKPGLARLRERLATAALPLAATA